MLVSPSVCEMDRSPTCSVAVGLGTGRLWGTVVNRGCHDYLAMP